MKKEKSTGYMCYVAHKTGKYGGCSVPHFHETKKKIDETCPCGHKCDEFGRCACCNKDAY